MSTQFLDRNPGQIAFDVTGTGPLVVCVPSMGDLRSEYRYLVPLLVDAGYTAATMDQRGIGESSTGWTDYSVAGVGSDILALVRHLDLGPAIVLGDSSGGGAAVWTAAEGPELVSGVVLIDAFVRDFPSLANTLLGKLFQVLFAGAWGAGMWTRFYRSLYPTRKPADFPAYTGRLHANLIEPGRLRSLRGQLAAPKVASEQRLAHVRAPVLVVFGSRDPDFKDPAAEAHWIASRVDGTVRMIDGAGHYPQAEMPEETAAAILPFLASLRLGEQNAVAPRS